MFISAISFFTDDCEVRARFRTRSIDEGLAKVRQWLPAVELVDLSEAERRTKGALWLSPDVTGALFVGNTWVGCVVSSPDAVWPEPPATVSDYLRPGEVAP